MKNAYWNLHELGRRMKSKAFWVVYYPKYKNSEIGYSPREIECGRPDTCVDSSAAIPMNAERQRRRATLFWPSQLHVPPQIRPPSIPITAGTGWVCTGHVKILIIIIIIITVVLIIIVIWLRPWLKFSRFRGQCNLKFWRENVVPQRDISAGSRRRHPTFICRWNSKRATFQRYDAFHLMIYLVVDRR